MKSPSPLGLAVLVCAALPACLAIAAPPAIAPSRRALRGDRKPARGEEDH